MKNMPFLHLRLSAWKVLTAIVAALFVLFACQKDETETKKTEFHSLEDFKGYKACVVAGSVQDISISEVIPEKDILRISSLAEDFASVQSGTADFAAFDTICLIGVDLQQRGLEMALAMEDFKSMAAAFRFEDKQLCSQFNTFLSEIKANGIYDSIIKRWTSGDIEKATMPKIDMPKTGTPIRVGTMGSDFPATFIKDGKWAGFETELIYRFAQYINRPVELYDYEFGALIAALNTKKVDAIFATMCVTEERAKSVLFSDPYYFTRTVIIKRTDNAVAQTKVSFGEKLKTSFRRNLIEEDRWKLIAEGLGETLFISVFAILLGIIVGALICAMRMSRSKVLRGTAIAYVEIMRGVPILVFLMIMFYIVFATSRVTATWVAIFAFALNFGAYVSEMFRTGIEGVDKGQIEAGRAMGFSSYGTFVNFVMPQALKSIFPVFKGEAVSLIKNTSVVGYIAIQDLTKASDLIRSRTFDAFFPLIVITIIYFLLAWLLGLLLEKLANRSPRRS